MNKMTVGDLQRRCTDAAKRIGPTACVTAWVRSGLGNSLSIYTDANKLTGWRHISANNGWDAAFAEVDAWLLSRPDPDAEFASWFAAAEPLAAE